MKNKKKKFLVYFLILIILNKLVFPNVYMNFIDTNNISYLLTIIGSMLLVLLSQNLDKSIVIEGESKGLPKELVLQGIIEIFCLVIVVVIISDIILKAKLAQNINFYFEEFTNEQNILEKIISLLVLGVFPAVAEELYFRQTLYNFFKPIKQKQIFIGLSGLSFALFHTDVLSKIFAFILGMVLMQIYLLCRNIKFVIILHTLYNWCMLFYTFFRPIVYKNILSSIYQSTKIDFISSVLLELGVLNLIIGLIIGLYGNFVNKNIVYHERNKNNE